jgi:HK97 family phage major capsid protein
LLPQIAARGGVSLNFDNTNNVIIPFHNSGSLGGAFIGEGQAIPVKATSFGSKTVKQSKLGVITVATSEILTKSTPAIEPILRDAILKDTAAVLDAAAFSATAATAVSPAGLLVGVTAVTPAGTAASVRTLAQVLAAVRAMGKKFTDANRSLANVVAVMTPDTRLGLSLVANSVGQYPLQAELAAGRFMGMDVISSNAAPANTITFIDASEMWFGLGAPQFQVSDSAALAMDDGAPAAGSPTRSLFQTDSYAIRMIAHTGWADVRSGSVQQIDDLVV